MENGFRIKITTISGREAFVAKEDHGVCRTWDGAWYTENQPEQIKIWKTRRGAQKWLDDRSIIRDTMGAQIEPLSAEPAHALVVYYETEMYGPTKTISFSVMLTALRSIPSIPTLAVVVSIGRPRTVNNAVRTSSKARGGAFTMNMTLYAVIAIFADRAAINGERPMFEGAFTDLDVAGEHMLKLHSRLRTRNPKTYLRSETWIFKSGKKLLFAEISKTAALDIV